MKPWREVAIPRHDVLTGTFQQAEFAADITAVRNGKASREYQDAVAFFDQTFITEGMRRLLTQVAQRLAGKGGEPVIQLQTAFGGGKTHTMLAVWHLATRTTALKELAGVPELIDAAGLMDVPQARVAVLDGTAHGPSQPWQHGKLTVRTLWGELAWQLGGLDAYEHVRKSDEAGTSPGKDILQTVLAAYAPCVILIDELVAYVRQFEEGKQYTGGSYDSNVSFIQSLTEAAKLVPNALVLASLPESEVEAGSQRGVAALKALEKIFGRVQALWKPVAAEEAFAIVRRRLFAPLKDTAAVRSVCRAFADSYIAEGASLPVETQESRYVDRLVEAYPIHPEVFDRLYEDWTTIDGFQRTRGVLKLMAKVIYRLWDDANHDLLIMPGSLPLADSSSRNELTYYLPAGWDAVVERDIDGPRAETTELENHEPRFGQLQAARRVARTLFLGSAPSSVASKNGIRGQDRGRILLGCLQPNQSASVYSDALNRLTDRLHYMSSSGDKTQSTTRFWFDTRANLRREMEDRKRRFDEKTEVRKKICEIVEKTVGRTPLVDGVHVFTNHGDVPDDSALRLVILPPEAWYRREENRYSTEAVTEFLKHNGQRPRLRSNRLLFLAADQAVVSRLEDATKVALAWTSIVDDIQAGRLNIDILQKNQAETELRGATETLPRIVRECYRWLLCPRQEDATMKPEVEAYPIPTGTSSWSGELERLCKENELIIPAWSPVHLRTILASWYWKHDKSDVSAMTVWEDSLRYIYLPRLRNREVLAQTINEGTKSSDFFGIAYGTSSAGYEGFQLGTGSAQFDDTLLLIEPKKAAAYAQEQASKTKSEQLSATEPPSQTLLNRPSAYTPSKSTPFPEAQPSTQSASFSHRKKLFIGNTDLPPATARLKFDELHKEIIQHLAKDPNATVRVTVTIQAEFEQGAPEDLRRTISENATALKLTTAEWE